MSKPTDIRICEATCSTQYLKYRAPAKFGGRTVTDVVLLDVAVEVETRDGRRGQGTGSMPMGNIWAWPSRMLSTEQTLAAMIELGKRLVDDAARCRDYGHPLELTRVLESSRASTVDAVAAEANLTEPMPRLAQLVAASPLEAAVHDAYGKALGQNSYNLLGSEFASADLAAYLSNDFVGEYLDRHTLRQPKPRLPLYHLIGALDPLTDADIKTRIGDGTPETLPEWIAHDGLTHLKIKLDGADPKWDVERVLAIERVAAETQTARGRSQWYYSADFNERCANVEYLLDFLARVGERSPKALARLQYIEQPTARDLRADPDNRVHRAARIKPVVIDESLVDFESLVTARELGYSGVALKACKGQTGALLMAAAAQKFGMFLCVQDLTCPGASFLHSATLAARIPGVAALEGNARQYCPAGNAGWAERFPATFRVRDGMIETGALDRPGLGF
jgi:L-alanine-DL-glutamate epimerase-like enolase superfamily enzyme